MAIPFTDILQDRVFPVGVYAHFNDIVFYSLGSVYALKGLMRQYFTRLILADAFIK
jgi:hypothetical protein